MGSGRRKRALLVGPYGGTNLGDDAILTCILTALRSMNIEIVISCSSPEVVASMTGLETVPLLNFRAGETSVLRTLSHVDAVIIGGGQQLSQPRLPNPIWGHLARTCHMTRLASYRDIPTVLWGVGMDWPLSPISKWMLRRFLGAQSVTALMRDNASFRHLQSVLAGRPGTQRRVADMAFLVPKEDSEQGRRMLCHELGHADKGQDYVILSPAYDKVSNTAYYAAMVEAGQALVTQGYQVVGWHTDLQPGYDMQLRQMPNWEQIPSFAWLPAKAYTTKQVAAMLGASGLLITGRLHPAIIAATQGTPVIGIARSSKMTEILQDAEIMHLSPDVADGSELLRLAKSMLASDNPGSSEAIQRQRQQATLGVQLVQELVAAGL